MTCAHEQASIIRFDPIKKTGYPCSIERVAKELEHSIAMQEVVGSNETSVSAWMLASNSHSSKMGSSDSLKVARKRAGHITLQCR